MKGKRNSEGVMGRALEGKAPKDADALPVTLALVSRDAERTPCGVETRPADHRPTATATDPPAGSFQPLPASFHSLSSVHAFAPRGSAVSHVGRPAAALASVFVF